METPIAGLRVFNLDESGLERSVVCMAQSLHESGALQYGATWGPGGVRATPMLRMLLASDYVQYDYEIGFEFAWPNCAKWQGIPLLNLNEVNVTDEYGRLAPWLLLDGEHAAMVGHLAGLDGFNGGSAANLLNIYEANSSTKCGKHSDQKQYGWSANLSATTGVWKRLPRFCMAPANGSGDVFSVEGSRKLVVYGSATNKSNVHWVESGVGAAGSLRISASYRQVRVLPLRAEAVFWESCLLGELRIEALLQAAEEAEMKWLRRLFFQGRSRLQKNSAWMLAKAAIRLKLEQLHRRISEACISDVGLSGQVGSWVSSIQRQQAQWARDVRSAQHMGLPAESLPQEVGKLGLVIQTLRVVRREPISRPLSRGQEPVAKRARVVVRGSFVVTFN